MPRHAHLPVLGPRPRRRRIVRDYSTSNTFGWTPSTAGTYALEVDVRDQGATSSYERVSNIFYTIS
ncbi:MAG TPA: hypothetical protein VGR23_05860 [Candidatus Dormibacteraeota bacterium]|nr:hypothetical protein [Candidatus Dormibacteraeota bacterium]